MSQGDGSDDSLCTTGFRLSKPSLTLRTGMTFILDGHTGFFHSLVLVNGNNERLYMN